MGDLLINVNQFIYSKGNQIRFDLQNGVKFTVSITIFLTVNFLVFSSILSVRGMWATYGLHRMRRNGLQKFMPINFKVSICLSTSASILSAKFCLPKVQHPFPRSDNCYGKMPSSIPSKLIVSAIDYNDIESLSSSENETTKYWSV